MTPPSRIPTHRVLRSPAIRAVSAASIVAVLGLNARVTAETPTTDELNRRLTALETTTGKLKADVEASQIAQIQKDLTAIVFASAWLIVSFFRENTQRHEFKARQEERLVEASTAQATALAALIRRLNPEAADTNTTRGLVASILKQTANHIEKNP